MTKTNIVERPENTLSPEYAKVKHNIKKWREDHKEYVTEYNREYQRKLRQDPVKYEEMRMRISLRSYLRGSWKVSYKMQSFLGMTRNQLAQKYAMTEAEFSKYISQNECDHIIPASWFNDQKNIHLKPYMYRHYNLQIVPKHSNRTKHSWVDEEDIRVKLVKARMELDHENATNDYSKDKMLKIKALAKKAINLENEIYRKYKK
jgi:hypothetical protein